MGDPPPSPSLPPRNPRNSQMSLGAPPSKKHLHTPPLTVQRRRMEIALVDDKAKRCVCFWRRREGLFSKASALCQLTGARAAVIVFSSTGKLYSSDDLSVEETAEIIFDYIRCNGGAMPPMGPKEGVDSVKKQRRPTEIAKSADQVRMRRAFSRRYKTLFKMATELCTKTDARAAVIVFSNTGELHSRGIPSVEDTISDWVGKQHESCVTEEDIDSLNLKYEPVLHYVGEKLKDIRGSGNSGVGVDCDSEVLNDDKIDSLKKNFEASPSSPSALIKNIDWDSLHRGVAEFFGSSESSGVESTSDHEDCDEDTDRYLDFSSEDADGNLSLPQDRNGFRPRL